MVGLHNTSTWICSLFLLNVQGPFDFKSVDVKFPFPEDLTDLLISTTLASSQGLGRFCPIPCKSELYKCVPHSWIEHKTCLLNLNYRIEYTKILLHRAPFPIGCHYMHWHRLLEPVFVCWTISIYLICNKYGKRKKAEMRTVCFDLEDNFGILDYFCCINIAIIRATVAVICCPIVALLRKSGNTSFPLCNPTAAGHFIRKYFYRDFLAGKFGQI